MLWWLSIMITTETMMKGMCFRTGSRNSFCDNNFRRIRSLLLRLFVGRIFSSKQRTRWCRSSSSRLLIVSLINRTRFIFFSYNYQSRVNTTTLWCWFGYFGLLCLNGRSSLLLLFVFIALLLLFLIIVVSMRF